MINVDKAYKCPICHTMIETYLRIEHNKKIMFICPSCSKSHTLSEKEYLDYVRNSSGSKTTK